jgi:hypothetical protein
LLVVALTNRGQREPDPKWLRRFGISSLRWDQRWDRIVETIPVSPSSPDRYGGRVSVECTSLPNTHDRSGCAAGYLLVEVPIDEPPEREAFSFFAWRFSFSDLLAAVFELFEPPLSLLAMVASSKRRDPSAERTTPGTGEGGNRTPNLGGRKGQE